MVKRKLETSSHNWVDELQSVLWAYRTTVRTTTKDTPFGLVYGAEAVIPVEMLLPRLRVQHAQAEANEDGLRASVDLLEERRNTSKVRQNAYKILTEQHYNKKVKGLACRVGELNEASRQEWTRKLRPKWEGPYRVVEARRNGSYIL
ncbi:hypothetical protein LXL04_030133 [Taraxacum kok-saghyz]